MRQHWLVEQVTVCARSYTAEGVYAALAVPSKDMAVNAAIVDLGDRTLVFDTLATLQAARGLRAAAERLTGRAPAVVVNSQG